MRLQTIAKQCIANMPVKLLVTTTTTATSWTTTAAACGSALQAPI